MSLGTALSRSAYTLFYVLGTLDAIQFPVVGLAPLKSLEQFEPMLAFFVIQILYGFQLRRQMRPTESLRDFRVFQLSLLGVLVAVVLLFLWVFLLRWDTLVHCHLV
jgi:dolichyl-diphosphooligosaccharide--protein glycosyltransferase